MRNEKEGMKRNKLMGMVDKINKWEEKEEKEKEEQYRQEVRRKLLIEHELKDLEEEGFF